MIINKNTKIKDIIKKYSNINWSVESFNGLDYIIEYCKHNNEEVELFFKDNKPFVKIGGESEI